MTFRSGFCVLALLLLVASIAFGATPFMNIANGNGNVAPGKAIYKTGVAPLGVVVFDTNIAVANGGSDSVSVFTGGCSNSPSLYCSYSLKGDFPAGMGPTSIEKAHFVNASAWDLVVSDNIGAKVTILINDGSNGFAQTKSFSVGDYPETVAVGDFDNNGGTDIAVTNATAATPTVTLLMNTCTGVCSQSALNFVKKTLPPLPNSVLPWGLATGKFAGSAKVDLVVANYYSYGYGVNGADVLLNNRGTPWAGFGTAKNYPGGFYAPYVATGHFTNELATRDDFAITNYGGKILIFQNDGSGNFPTSPTKLPGGTTPLAITNVGNVGGDGRDDLVVTNFYSNQISVLISKLGSTYYAPVSRTVGKYPSAVTAGVLGAGKMLIVVNELDGNIWILY